MGNGLVLNGASQKGKGRKEADVVHPWKMARSLTALSTRPPARLMAPIDKTLRGIDLFRLPPEQPPYELKPGLAWHRREDGRDLGSVRASDLEAKSLDECLPVEKTTGRGRWSAQLSDSGDLSRRRRPRHLTFLRRRRRRGKRMKASKLHR